MDIDVIARRVRQERDRYPSCGLADYYKLIYQGITGSRHGVAEASRVIEILHRECRQIQPRSDHALTDDITLDYPTVRLHLAVCMSRGIPLDLVAREFVEGMGDFPETEWDRLSAAMDELQAVLRSAPYRYSSRELHSFFEPLREAGFPPAGHSMTYRRMYSPGYRVLPAHRVPHLTTVLE